MRKLMILLIGIMLIVSFNYYVKFTKLSREYNNLINKKDEYEKLVDKINMYDEYEKAYTLVFNDGLSLEDRVKKLENDINTKNEKIEYYKKSISDLNNKMK